MLKILEYKFKKLFSYESCTNVQKLLNGKHNIFELEMCRVSWVG